MYHFDEAAQREKFKNHVAKFTDLGFIKVIDFQNPETSNYRIRFMFEEDHYRLHISGDIGELIATNFNNMTFEKFERDYVNNTGYFEGKIDCMSRSLYDWDEDEAREDLFYWINEFELRDRILLTKRTWDVCSDDEFINEYVDELLYDFDPDHGMSRKSVDKVMEDYVDCDFWETAGTIGRRSTGVLELYMLAYKLAMEQIRSKKQ